MEDLQEAVQSYRHVRQPNQLHSQVQGHFQDYGGGCSDIPDLYRSHCRGWALPIEHGEKDRADYQLQN